MIVRYTDPILTISQDHLKKHAKEGDISCETLDAVKKLKPHVKDSTPQAKAAERWSLTYRYLHKLSSGDKIPSPCKLSILDLVYHSVSSRTIHTDYQRPEESFGRPSQSFAAEPENSESSRDEPKGQDFVSHLSSSHAPDQVAFHSDRSPSQPQHLPDMQAEHQSSTRARKRDVEAAAPLSLDPGVPVNARDRDGRTALIRVVESGDQETARLLLEWGAAVDARDADGRTPLLRAVLFQHDEMVKLLLEWGAAVDAQDMKGRTPLSWAAQTGHEAEVKLLLEGGAAVDVQDTFGGTPLSLAAQTGHEAEVKLLLEGGRLSTHRIRLGKHRCGGQQRWGKW